LENEYKSVFNNNKGIDNQIKLYSETNIYKLNNKIVSKKRVSKETQTYVQNEQQLNSITHNINNELMVNIIDNNTEDKSERKQTQNYVYPNQLNNQTNSHSNEDQNNDSNSVINEDIINEKIESKKKLSINELMKKIKTNQVLTEIDKNDEFIKGLKALKSFLRFN